MNYENILKYIFMMRQKILKVYLLDLIEHSINKDNNNDSTIYNDLNISNNLNNQLYIIKTKINNIDTILHNLNKKYILVHISELHTKLNQLGGKKNKLLLIDPMQIQQHKQYYMNQIELLQNKIIQMTQQNQILISQQKIFQMTQQNLQLNEQNKLIQMVQQNQSLMDQLSLCNTNIKISNIEKDSLNDKLLFFEKSLDTVAQSISNNISNGKERIETLHAHIKNTKNIIFDVNLKVNDVKQEVLPEETIDPIELKYKTN